jgi:NAD(P)-dependent dehydrogenase (short-subunit alcohol dehydrogenase family)
MRQQRTNSMLPLLLGGLAAAWGVRAAVWATRSINLRRKVVIITGGTRGLGLELARQFAREGARLAICARDEVEVNRARDDLVRHYGANVIGIQCDITVKDQVDGMIDGILRHFGEIDVVVNNAGIIQVGPMETMVLEDYAEAMRTHYWSTVYTTLAVLPHMKSRAQGRIVNISSIGGKISPPHLLPYNASKFAVTGFSEGLRAELLKDGIYVTTVCPGLMRTGSPRNAFFKGRHREEYAWFAVSDSLPGIAMSSTRAARRIVRACRRGEAEVILTLAARLGARFHGLFPGLTTEILALINPLLPAPGGIGTRRARGYESESAVAPSALTALTERAAQRNNEIGTGEPFLDSAAQ